MMTAREIRSWGMPLYMVEIECPICYTTESGAPDDLVERLKDWQIVDRRPVHGVVCPSCLPKVAASQPKK